MAMAMATATATYRTSLNLIDGEGGGGGGARAAIATPREVQFLLRISPKSTPSNPKFSRCAAARDPAAGPPPAGPRKETPPIALKKSTMSFHLSFVLTI